MYPPIILTAVSYTHLDVYKRQVWGWGSNSHGILGAEGILYLEPVQVSNLSNVIAIACNNGAALALKSDGTVWSWGYNSNGQLGDCLLYTSFYISFLNINYK